VNHLQVLREVEARGLRLTVSGPDLRLQGPQQRVDAGLVGRIRAVKEELIGYLSEQERSYPLTLLQRGYLIGRGDSVEIGNVASHVYHEIDGCWDIGRLESALRLVVARHGMLRTRCTADGRQVEEPAVDVRIGRLDLRGESEAAQRARLGQLREERSHRLLPLDRAPLLAAEVTLLADDRMRLHVSHDGLVMDGISMFLFFQDWWDGYAAASPAAGGPVAGNSGGPAAGGSGGPAAGPVSFADYVVSLAAMRAKPPTQRSRAYWLDRLADLPPHPALPLATSPAAITRPRFVQYAARLGPADWAAVKARAAAAGLTPTGVLLAAYAEVLARWGAGDRFTLTTTVANRPPIHPRIADAVGNFSETLLVEIEIDSRRTFAGRARALQTRLRRDLDHRHFSGIEVLRELARRDSGGDARMPFTFNSAIGYLRADVDGSALELFGPEVYTSSQTPQVWLNAFAFEQHGGVVVQVDAVDGLFPAGLIGAMVGGYAELLTSLTGEAAWSATTFDLLPREQRARRAAANDTTRPVPGGLLPDAFAARAAHAPDAPAILTTTATVSYGELARRVAQAAAWLRARQVGRDELVGLIMHRGPEQVVGILAALLAGGAYLPVDASLPAERIRYMLRDGQVRCVLTNAGWQPGDDGNGIEALALDVASPLGPDGPPPGAPVPGAPVPAAAVSAAAVSGAALPGAAPDDLAYVLYTSGTTGEPKGVMISHRSVANVVADCNERFGITAADRFIALSAFSFDLSVYDVFGALSAGAALVLPDAGRAADPAHWLELCGRFGVTVWNSVPAIAALLQEQAEPGGDPRLHALRLVMMSGDRIPPALPAALRRLRDGLTLVSLGGPTETTIWNILHPIGPDGGAANGGAADGGAADGGGTGGAAGAAAIPYGRPNANNRAYILDADGLDAPDWVTGEICAAGAGLARGYWADQARTAERFWSDERRGERLYRTGDLGYYRPDGDITIAGRSDFQIKVNGYRIEAGEVETRLAAIDVVKQAVVVRQAAARGDRLVAHLVPAGDARPSETQIRRALREHLPDYMTPSAVVWHESLPLTGNGKVDRARLTALPPGAAATPGAAGAGAARDGQPRAGLPRTAETAGIERWLTDTWASVLRLPPASVSPGSDFYDLGGDSLAAARVFTAVRKQFGVSITLDRLYDVRTVESMAAHIEAGRTGDPA
jgi:pyochelin synthetase